MSNCSFSCCFDKKQTFTKRTKNKVVIVMSLNNWQHNEEVFYTSFLVGFPKFVKIDLMKTVTQ